MEEIIVERTIKLLQEKLNRQVVKTWAKIDDGLLNINPDHVISTPPFEFKDKDFFRFNLEETVANSNKRIIVGCERSIADSSNRGDIANDYTLEIMFMYETNYSDIRSRIYIPLRYREAIIRTIGENYREITNHSSFISLEDLGVVESDNEGNRSIVAGVVYQVVA